jgi:hypothetical protein
MTHPPTRLLTLLLQVATLALLSSWGQASASTGESSPASTRRLATFDLQLAANPRGAMLASALVWRHRFASDGSALWSDNHVEAAASANLAPAFGELGGWLELRRPALLVVRVGYHAIPMFGAFGYAMSFDEDGTWSDDDVAAREDSDARAGAIDGPSQAGLGHRALVQPTLQLRAGSVIVRNQWTLASYWLPFTSHHIRERLFDRLIASGDQVVASSAQLLYEAWDGPGEARALVGSFHEWSTTVGSGISRHRVGAIGVWIPDDAWRGCSRPRAYLQTGVNLRDRNYEEEFFAQGGVGCDIGIPSP